MPWYSVSSRAHKSFSLGHCKVPLSPLSIRSSFYFRNPVCRLMYYGYSHHCRPKALCLRYQGKHEKLISITASLNTCFTKWQWWVRKMQPAGALPLKCNNVKKKKGKSCYVKVWQYLYKQLLGPDSLINLVLLE